MAAEAFDGSLTDLYIPKQRTTRVAGEVGRLIAAIRMIIPGTERCTRA